MKIGFLGGGKMAEGIISAILGAASDRAMSPSELLVAEMVEARRREINAKYRVNVTDDVRQVASSVDVVFLAVRPQDVDTVAQAVAPILTGRQVLVSIVAGKRLEILRRAFGDKVKLVRVMPNLALRANAGMCAVCGAAETPREDVEAVAAILGAAGETAILEESDFDAVTALSGSGPAYFAYMERAMMEGGIALGLKPDVARLLAEQTMFGTAKFLRESKADLDAFISGVCTKGGTTAAGMVELEKGGDFRRIVAATLAAAAQRSKELA